MINVKFRLTPVKIRKSYKSYISTRLESVFQPRKWTNNTPRLFTHFRGPNNGREEGARMNFPLKLIYGGWNGKFLADDSTE